MPLMPDNVDTALDYALDAGRRAALAVWIRDGKVDRGSCGGSVMILDRRSKLAKAAVARGIAYKEGMVILLPPAGIQSQNADVWQALYGAFRDSLEAYGFGPAIKKFWNYID